VIVGAQIFQIYDPTDVTSPDKWRQIDGSGLSDRKSGLQRSVIALIPPRSGAGLLALPTAGQFRGV
jgi:hypothetical protein